MVRGLAAAAALLMSACGSETAPAGHRTWRMTFHPEPGSGCALQLDGGLDIETWVPHSGEEFIRFVNAPALRPGRAVPIELPEGLRSRNSRFDWSDTFEVITGEQVGSSSQRLSLELFDGDAGVEGLMILSSNYNCMRGCDVPSGFGGCTARLPVKLHEVEVPPFPIRVAAEPLDGGTMMTVALQTSGTCADGFGGNVLKFERWSFSDDVVRMPSPPPYFSPWVNRTYQGELTSDGFWWKWLSEPDPQARPRALITLSKFDFIKHDAYETVVESSVTSQCSTEACGARACEQRTTVFVMREEQP